MPRYQSASNWNIGTMWRLLGAGTLIKQKGGCAGFAGWCNLGHTGGSGLAPQNGQPIARWVQQLQWNGAKRQRMQASTQTLKLGSAAWHFSRSCAGGRRPPHGGATVNAKGWQQKNASPRSVTLAHAVGQAAAAQALASRCSQLGRRARTARCAPPQQQAGWRGGVRCLPQRTPCTLRSRSLSDSWQPRSAQ